MKPYKVEILSAANATNGNELYIREANKKSDLEVENARLTALESIENSSVAKEMTTPETVNYAD